MSVIYKFLFPSKPDGTAMSLLILALRILFGFHFRIPLSLGNASDDLHHVYRILCCSWF